MFASNIDIIKVKNQLEGSHVALKLLKHQADDQTALWLSGGSSPQGLYRILAHSYSLPLMKGEIKRGLPAAVALVDERFPPSPRLKSGLRRTSGSPLHKDSNELMIRQTGLIESLEKKNTPFYSPLDSRFLILGSLTQTAANYNKAINQLINKFNKHVLIMGLGPDGHTASIFPDMPSNVTVSSSNRGTLRQAQGDTKYVIGYSTKLNEFSDRITLTFKALKELSKKDSHFIILAFGDNKKEAIQKMLQKDPSTPAAIYNKFNAVTLITDQD